MIMTMVTSILLLISEGRGGRRRAGGGAGGVSSSSLCSADYCHLDCDNFDEQENYDHYGHYHYKNLRQCTECILQHHRRCLGHRCLRCFDCAASLPGKHICHIFCLKTYDSIYHLQASLLRGLLCPHEAGETSALVQLRILEEE